MRRSEGSAPRRASPRKPPSLTAALKAAMCRQVFGLADMDRSLATDPTYSPPLPSLGRPVRWELSFPLTAAGQFRIRTGFPIKPIRPWV
ncbi:hypothetical protein GCM10009429_16360 [Dyella marensis]